MLWVLNRTLLGEALLMSTTTYVFFLRNKKKINTFGLKKASYQELKGVYFKRKELVPLEVILFPFRVDPFSEGT